MPSRDFEPASSSSAAPDANERMWRALAGEHYDDIMKCPESTMKYLHNESWKLRFAAISVLRMVWKSYDELAAVCEKIAFEDADAQVRATAIFTLGCCFKNKNDSRVGRLLAQVVHDESLSDSFRESAYSGLFWLRGVPAWELPIRGKFSFPDDIDWVFVGSFLREGDKQKEEGAGLLSSEELAIHIVDTLVDDGIISARFNNVVASVKRELDTQYGEGRTMLSPEDRDA
jgi:hypothetical protein